jgi:hypothetical protein
MHRAGAALRDAAAEFRAFELQFVTNDPQKRCVRRAFGCDGLPIQIELDHD